MYRKKHILYKAKIKTYCTYSVEYQKPYNFQLKFYKLMSNRRIKSKLVWPPESRFFLNGMLGTQIPLQCV